MTFTTFFNPATSSPPPDIGLPRGTRRPADTHASLPGYAATPLLRSEPLAQRLGVASVLIKNEFERLGLPSFKILGASWAVLTTVREAWAPNLQDLLTVASVKAAMGDPTGRGLVAATDGNHGRGVARMARLLGVGAHILVPVGTSASRIDAIASEGATVEVVDGTYDDAIAAAAALADDTRLVVSDTSWDGYDDTPRAVVEGYSTMFHEIDQQVRQDALPPPDLVVFQAGVGAFAAAGLRHYREHDGTAPRTMLVEPATANCLMASAQAGDLVTVPGPHSSSMAGLNCGRPSQLVWPLIRATTDVFVGIDDGQAEEAMRALAGEGVVAGESGAAGLGGLLAVHDLCDEPDRRRAGLTSEACVLVVNTEGATDPDNYARVVGRTATDVLSGAGAADRADGRASVPTAPSGADR